MLYIATVSFSGKITMSKGKVGEISDQTLVDDLLKAGYIIPYEADEKPKKSKTKEETPTEEIPQSETKEDKPKKRKGKTE